MLRNALVIWRGRSVRVRLFEPSSPVCTLSYLLCMPHSGTHEHIESWFRALRVSPPQVPESPILLREDCDRFYRIDCPNWNSTYSPEYTRAPGGSGSDYSKGSARFGFDPACCPNESPTIDSKDDYCRGRHLNVEHQSSPPALARGTLRRRGGGGRNTVEPHPGTVFQGGCSVRIVGVYNRSNPLPALYVLSHPGMTLPIILAWRESVSIFQSHVKHSTGGVYSPLQILIR